MRTALLFLFAAIAWSQDIASKVDEYVTAHVRMKRFNGSVLLAKDGKVLASKGYGMANFEHDVPNTTATKFRLGSITKQFTATAILQLAEQGKLSLADTAKKYVPDSHESWDKVTITHLLNHTSGVPSFTSFPDYREFKMHATTPEKLIARFSQKPLEFQPGEKYTYSNSGYYLLGFIVEKVSGKSYANYLTDHIFTPAGMSNSGYDTPQLTRYRAAGYSPDGDRGFRNADFINMTIPGGAGALYSTVEDLLKWDQALYTEKVLSKKSIDAMFTANKNDYGYGWVIRTENGRRTMGHGGGIEGFNTMIQRYPDDRLVVIVLSNVNTPVTGRMANDLAAIAFGEKYELPRERKAITVDSKILNRYIGRYVFRPQFAIEVTREGDRLMGQATNQPKVEMFAETETVFFLKVVEAEMRFVTDENGIPQEMVLTQGGREMRGKRESN